MTTTAKFADYDAGYAEGYDDGVCDTMCDGECAYDDGFNDGEQEGKTLWAETLYAALTTRGVPILDGVRVSWDAAERCFVFHDGEREVRVK